MGDGCACLVVRLGTTHRLKPVAIPAGQLLKILFECLGPRKMLVCLSIFFGELWRPSEQLWTIHELLYRLFRMLLSDHVEYDVRPRFPRFRMGHYLVADLVPYSPSAEYEHVVRHRQRTAQ